MWEAFSGIGHFHPIEHLLYAFSAEFLSSPVGGAQYEIEVFIYGAVREQPQFLVHDAYLAAQVLKFASAYLAHIMVHDHCTSVVDRCVSVHAGQQCAFSTTYQTGKVYHFAWLYLQVDS
jgi:hypothetical protein